MVYLVITILTTSFSDKTLKTFTMEQAALILQWNNHQQTLAGAVESLQLTSPDVNLVCSDNGKRFSGNKIALSASSPFFYSLLKDHLLPPEVFIILSEVNSTHFESILAFIQTGTMTIAKTELDAVLVLATQLQIQCFSGIESQFPQRSSAGWGSSEPSIQSKHPECSLEVKSETDTDTDVIDEECYQNLKTHLIEEKLIKETGGWICLFCERKWADDNNNVRRHAKRHMESHLHVRFQCLGCGNVLKTKESFYFHRSNYCRNLYNVSAEPGFQMLLSKEKEDEEKNANASIDKETKEAQHKPDEENEDCQVGTQKHGLRSTRQGNI